MNPIEFMKTVYLGDRACKGIYIDSWNKSVSIHVDAISRIRSKTGNWEYYNEENVEDGCLVFTRVRSIIFDPPGPIPNDYMDLVDVVHIPENNDYVCSFFVGSVDKNGCTTPVSITIEAESVHIEDPFNPGVKITE